jgi:K+ transporter
MTGRGPGHPRHDAAARGQPGDESVSQASRGSVAALGIVYAAIGTSPLGSENRRVDCVGNRSLFASKTWGSPI